jgi:hypothetical protein
MLKIETIDPDDILKQLKGLPKRLEHVKYAIGSMMADRISNDVVRRIPAKAGWMSIYRDSIDFFYDGKEWAVAGEADGGSIKNYDADFNLISFVAVDTATQVMAQYNPWPLDMVPALNKPYKGRVVIRSASKAQVEVRRRLLSSVMPTIKRTLQGEGYNININGMPIINGNVTADLRTFSRQLEEGRGHYPFPSIPHWRPAASNVDNSIRVSLAMAKSKFESILRGDLPSKPKVMSSRMRSTISQYARHAPGA